MIKIILRNIRIANCDVAIDKFFRSLDCLFEAVYVFRMFCNNIFYALLICFEFYNTFFQISYTEFSSQKFFQNINI